MTTLSKWGNSLAVRIPSAIAQKLALKEGSAIVIDIEKNAIVIKPVSNKKEYTLEELLEGMTPRHFHPETDTGIAVGNEEW
jgi:antitoxin MazE